MGWTKVIRQPRGNHCPGKSDEHRGTFQKKRKTEQTWTEDSLHLGTSWKRPEKDGKAGTKGCIEGDDLSQLVLIVVLMIYSPRKNTALRIQTRRNSLSDVYKSVERGEHVKHFGLGSGFTQPKPLTRNAFHPLLERQGLSGDLSCKIQTMTLR